VKARLIFVCCALCTGWSSARPTVEQLQGFVEKLEIRQQAGDLRGILEQAGQDPELSGIVVHDWPLEKMTPARRRLLTLVARGLDLAGNPKPLADLKQVSAEEAALTLAVAPHVDVAARLEGVDWTYWGIPNLERLIDLGNFRQVGELGEAYRAYLESSQGVDLPMEKLALFEASLLAGEFPYSADRRQQMVEWAQGDPSGEELPFLYALMVSQATDCGRPDVARQLLAPFEASLMRATPNRQALYRFVLETARYQLQLRDRSSPDLAELRRQHELAWKSLSGYHGNRSRETRIWLRGTDYWRSLLDNLILAEFHEEELLELALADNEEMLRLSGEALDQGSYGAQINSLAGLLQIELQGQWAEQRTLKQSLPVLELTSQTLGHYREWLSRDQIQQEQSLPPSIRQRLGANFHLDLMHGDLSMLVSRFLVLRQLHDNEGKNVGELIHESEATSSSRGISGFGDARYLLLRLSQQPDEIEALLLSLESEWQRNQFRPGIIAITMERGRRLAQQRKIPQAIAKLSRGIELLEKYLSDFGGGLGLLAGYRPDYELLARLQAESGLQREAFGTLARLNQVETMQRGSAALLQRPELAPLKQLGEQAAALQQQTSSAHSLGQPSAASSQLLAQNRQQVRQLLKGLLEQSPQYRQALRVEPVNLTAVQKDLPADTVLVQYLPGPQGLYLFILTRQGLKVRRVNVPARDLERAVARLRERIAGYPLHANPSKPFHWDAELVRDSRQLYDWLIRPLEQDLRGHLVLAIVPSGNLYYLPFACLIRSVGPKGPEFVAQRWQCVELVKAADLRELQSKALPARSGLVALANPDGSLPGAEREVRQIARFFPKAQLHVGQQARAQFLNPLPADTGYLHLATHGVLDARQPVESYLLMAGSRLRLSDVYGLSLGKVRLVTLSACQTALQASSAGSEVSSLAQAFSTAGGHAVLASLWSVSDDGTERLMSALYPRLAGGMSLSRSLQQAQLEVMAQPGFQHPFYWAAFSLFGDWR